MSRRRKWLLGILLTFATCAVVAVLSGWVFLNSDAGSNTVTELVKTAIAESVNGDVSVEVSVHGLSEVEIRNLSIKDKRGVPFLFLERAIGRISWTDLMVGEIAIEGVQVDRAIAQIRVVDGISNLDDLFITSDEPTTTELLIRILDADVKEMTFLYYDPDVMTGDMPPPTSWPTQEQLKKLIETAAAPNDAFEKPGPAIVSNLSVTMSGTIHTVGDIDFEILSAKPTVTVSDVLGRSDVTLNDVRVRTVGDLFQLNVEALDIENRVGVQKLRFAGRIPQGDDSTFDDHVLEVDSVEINRGWIAALVPSIELRNNANLSLRTEGAIPGDVAMEMDLSVADSKLRLVGTLLSGTTTEFEGVLDAQPIVFGDVMPFAPNGAFSGSVAFKGTGPDDVQARLMIETLNAEAYTISDSHLALHWNGKRLKIDESYLVYPPVVLTGTAEFSTAGDFLANLKTSVTPSAKSTIRADLSTDLLGSFDLGADSPVLGLKMLSANGSWNVANLSWDEPTISANRSAGAYRLALSPRAGSKRDLKLNVDATGNRMRYEKHYAGSFDVDADVKTTIDLETFSIDDLLAALRGDVRFNVSDVRTSGVSVRSAKGVAVAESKKSGYGFDVDAQVYGLATADVTLDHAVVDVTGDVGLQNGKLRRLKVAGKYDARRVKTGDASVDGVKGKVDVAGPVGDLTGNVTFDFVGAEAGGYAFKEGAGKVDLEDGGAFGVSVQGEQPEGKKPQKVKLVARGTHDRQYRNWTVDDVKANFAGDQTWDVSDGFSYDNGTLNFDDVTLRIGKQNVSVQGKFSPDESQEIKAVAKDVDIQEIAETFGITSLEKIRGRVSGEAEVAGTADDPEGRFSLTFADLYYDQVGPFEVNVSGRYVDRRAEIDTIGVVAFNRITGSGSGSIPVKVTQAGIEKFLVEEPLALDFKIGRFDLTGVTRETLKQETVKVLGKAEGNVRVKGSFREPDFSVSLDVIAMTIDGVVQDIDMNVGPIDATVKVDHRPAKQGRSELTGLAKISVASGASIRMQTSMVAPFSEALVATLDGREPAVDWLDAPFDIDLTADKFDLSKLNVGPLAENDVEGELTVKLKADGTVGDPSAGGSIDLDGFGWGRFRDVLLNGEYTLNEAGLSLEGFKLGWDGDDVFELSGAIPEPVAVATGEASWETSTMLANITLLPIPVSKLSAFDYQFAAIPGVMQGTATVKGTPRALSVETSGLVKEIRFADSKMGALEFAARLNTGELQGSAEVYRDGNMVAELSGSVPVSQDILAIAGGASLLGSGPLAGSMKIEKTPFKGLVPSSLLNKVVEDVGGTIDADISMFGDADAARFSGELNIQDGEATVLSLGRRFENASVGIRLNGDLVRIINIYVKDGTGFVSGNGEATLEKFRPKRVRARATAERFGIAGFSSVPAFVSGKLVMDGDISNESTTAEMKVTELAVEFPSADATGVFPTEMDEDVIVIKKGEETIGTIDDATSGQQVVDEIYAKFGVTIEDDAWIRHPVGSVRFKGDLDLEIANIGPMIRGEIETVEGTVETFGKTFKVDKGLVTFRGLDPPDPSLQIEAVHRYNKSLASQLGPASTGDARAIVRVTGRSSDPKIRFLSDPSMPEQDVIYALVTDRAPGSAGVGQAEAGLAQGAAASGLSGVASLVAGKMNQMLPKIAQVDVVRIESGSEGIRDSRLEVGKYLSPKFFLVYEYQFGADQDENENIGRFEYRFLPRWIFEVEVGDRAQGEFNILWDIY